MSKFFSRLHGWWQRLDWRRRVVVVVGSLLGVAFLLWVWPRKTAEVVRTDGAGRWTRHDAPPRRQIVWQPAETFPLPELPADAHAVTPKLTDGGATLYFSRRDAHGSADIFRSRLVDGRWTTPAAVAELNTSADDIGPVVTRDGQQLFLYSDRPGGHGGYDVYMAQRQNGQWTTPQNLGPHVNTPANEYDPAISADGHTLYFASNRTERMTQTTNKVRPWAGTLRAETGQQTYDLYRVVRVGQEWSVAEPLALLNQPDTNEGSPCVSPDGAFLYFASDRAGTNGRAHFDLYRIRLASAGDPVAASEIENLGPGVNSAADETEPALSPEGFRLVFASNRDGGDRIYASTAVEVYDETTWDTAHLRAFVNPWLWLAIFSTIAVLAGLWWLYIKRTQVVETIWPARFFLGSVLVNVLFVVLLIVWKLPGVIEAIVEHFEPKQEPVPASRIIDVEALQAAETARNEYAEVADLPPLEAAPPTDLLRKDLQDVPPADARPLALPDGPLVDVSALPLMAEPGTTPGPLVVVIPRARQQARTAPTPLPRRSVRELAEPVALSELPSDVQPVAVEPPVEATLSAAVSPLDRLPTEVSPTRVPQPTPEITTGEQKLLRQPHALERAPTRAADTPPVPLAVRLPKRLSALILPDRVAPRLDEAAVELASVELPTESPVATPLPDFDATPAQERSPALMPPPHESAAVPLSGPSVGPAPADAVQLASLNTTDPLQLPRPLPRPLPIKSVAESSPVELVRTETAAETPVDPREADLERIEVALPDRRLPVLPRPAELPQLSSARPLTTPLGERPRVLSPGLDSSRTQLVRRAVVAGRPAIVEDQTDLPSLLALRDPETRGKYAEVFGGTPETEAAVRRGLAWLAAHQNADGSWSLHRFHENCKGKHANCPGAGSEHSDTAATGLGVLPFLAAGYVPDSPDYGPVVAAGLKWLMDHQAPDGKVQGPGDNQVMYSHGIAAIALCEAYGMTKDEQLGSAARRAVDFISKAQNKSSGGWRYNPGEHGDTSVVGWQVMALKSAEMAGIAVPADTLERARKWLASVEGNKPVGGQFGYTGPSPNPAMTAEGLLCLQFLNEPRRSPRLGAGADYLAKHLPHKDQRHTSYYWYYATQVMYHMQGGHWQAWNDTLRPLLVETQEKNGHLAGTWEPRDQWEKRGGRIYTTSLKLLMLEVYYRHLPLYGTLNE